MTRHLPNKKMIISPSIGLVFLFVAFTGLLNSCSPPDNRGVPPGYARALIEKKAVVILMDTSGSMASMDLKPSRFEAVKKEALGFIKKRRNNPTGLTIFAGDFLELVPPESNHTDIIKAMETLKLGSLEDGTAIGTAIMSAVDSLSLVDCSNKSVILLTDGVNNSGKIDPRDSADVAKDFNIKVYTIGVGIEGKAPFPVTDPKGINKIIMVDVKIDERLLKEISTKTGGKYYRAQTGDHLKTIFEKIDKDLLNRPASNDNGIPGAIKNKHKFLLSYIQGLKQNKGKKENPKPYPIFINWTVGEKTAINYHTMALNDVLTYTVTVKGDTNAPTPDFSQLNDFKVAKTSSSTEMQFIGGKSTYSRSFKYYLVPLQKGPAKIPAIVYTLNGKTYKSQPFQINVTTKSSKPNKENTEIDFILKATVSSKNVSKGEEITYKITLYTNERIKSANMLSMQSIQGFFQEWEPAPATIEGEKTMLNGKNYTSFLLRKAILTPIKSGELIIPPLTFELVLGSSSPFKQKKIHRYTNAIKINVKH